MQHLTGHADDDSADAVRPRGTHPLEDILSAEAVLRTAD